MIKLKDLLTEKAKRDYKAEYKKFQSSDKSKKYRAELNAYNRKKGTYGNGDGKDASHKGGKIAGFEKESVNRGRREKSRLKKEGKLNEFNKKHFLNLIQKEVDSIKGQKAYVQDRLRDRELDGWEKKEYEAVYKELLKRAKELGVRLRNTKLMKEGHKISFSKEEMSKLHKDGSIEKDGHTYLYKEVKLLEGYYMSKQIAKDIVDQLGGRRFQAFVGAKKFLIDGKALFFKIGRNHKKINGIKIYYNHLDLYDIEFLRVSKNGTKVAKKVKNIYNDQLQDIFTKYTGMYTRF